jgi:hypothetical protein
MIKNNTMIWIGTIITFLGTCIILWVTNKKEEESDLKISELKSQNDNLSKQLIETTKQIRSEIIGEGGFCEISIRPQNNYAKITVINHSNTMQYNVSAIITDVTLFKKLEGKPNNEYMKAQTSLNIGNINPDSVIILPKINADFSSTDQHEFNVQFNTKNGHYIQSTILIRNDNKWQKKTVIKSIDGKVEIYQYKDSLFID